MPHLERVIVITSLSPVSEGPGSDRGIGIRWETLVSNDGEQMSLAQITGKRDIIERSTPPGGPQNMPDS